MLYENPEERWSTVASFGTLNKDETDYVVYSDIINIKQINDSNKIIGIIHAKFKHCDRLSLLYSVPVFF